VVVDAHAHVWQLARGDYAWLTPELGSIHRDFTIDDYAAVATAHEVDRVVLVQAAPTAAETTHLLRVASSAPIVGGVVGWADLAGPAARRELESRAADPVFKGVRPMLQDLPDPDWILQPALRPSLVALAELDLVLELLINPMHLPYALTLLDRHADLRVVVCHGAKPDIGAGGFQPWANDIAALARNTNAACKLSGLVNEAGPGWNVESLRPYVDHLLECFGPDRVVWGSDWPVLTLAATYTEWSTATDHLLADHPCTDRAKILGDNARRVYRL